MSTDIVVPELGESIVEARVARWLKKEGDPVAVGERAGRARNRQDRSRGRGDASRRARQDRAARGGGREDRRACSASSRSAHGRRGAAAATPPASAPTPPERPRRHAAHLRLSGSGRRAGRRVAPAGRPAPPSRARRRRRAASRSEHAVDLATVTGSGAGGRVTRQDVESMSPACGDAAAAGGRRPAGQPQRPPVSCGPARPRREVRCKPTPRASRRPPRPRSAIRPAPKSACGCRSAG